MTGILERLQKAEEVVALLRDELCKTSDGFFYTVRESFYGNNITTEVLNLKIASEICKIYNGDNGFVDLITNNPEAMKLHTGYSCTVIFTNSIEEYYNRKDALAFSEGKELESTVQNLEDISYFKNRMGLNVMNDDSYWLKSDENNS